MTYHGRVQAPPSPVVVLDRHRVEAAQRAATVVAEAGPGLLRLTTLARDLLGAKAAMVSLLDDDEEMLCAVVGLPPDYPEGLSLPIDLSLCVRIVESGRPLLLPDLRDDPVLRHHPAAVEAGLLSYAGVPLTSGALVIGAFCVLGEAARAWSEADVRLLQDLAGPVSTELQLRGALQRLTRARDAEHRAAAEQSVLRRVATAVANGEPPDRLVQTAAHELAGLLDAESVAVVRLLVDGRAQVVAGAGPVPADARLCAEVLAQVRAQESAVERTDGRGCRAAPVTVRGRLWGVVIASGSSYEGGLEQLTLLAHLLGVCVSNSEAHERLLELARTDPLTGAANRRAFTERLSEEVERSRRHGTSTTLALLDLDRFKALNDAHGHVTGDRVLCELVARVCHELRTADVLARLGGDEFALVLPDTDAAAATQVLDRVQAAITGAPLAGVELTVTIGGAVATDGRASGEALYRAADSALYRAKHAGRGSVSLDRLG